MTMLLNRRQARGSGGPESRSPRPTAPSGPAAPPTAPAAAAASTPGAQLIIDPAAVGANTRMFARRARGAVMAVVTADGLGHGAELVAAAALANGASWLGVAGLAEALALRSAGLRAPTLSWLNPVDADFGAAIGLNVDIAVPSREHLAAVAAAAAAAGQPARVHLHTDCGLARDGAPAWRWRELCEYASALRREGLVIVAGVMGHLGCADSPDDPCQTRARTRFCWAVRAAREAGLRPAHRHLAATAATLADQRAHHTMSRIGAGLVGIGPAWSGDGQPAGGQPASPGTPGLRFAMTLRAPVITVREAAAGTTVGCGHGWRAQRTTRLAVLGAGYADGIPRAAGDDAEVQLNGVRCRVVGRVALDQIVVDLGPAAARPGDQATVFGPGDDGEPTPADWARWAGTIPHEIVTGIGPRVSRVTAAPARS
jgi:alanine racemase